MHFYSLVRTINCSPVIITSKSCSNSYVIVMSLVAYLISLANRVLAREK